MVNIGYKSEGVIGASEFRYNPELRVGDVVSGSWAAGGNGQLVVSHRPPASTAWIKVK